MHGPTQTARVTRTHIHTTETIINPQLPVAAKQAGDAPTPATPTRAHIPASSESGLSSLQNQRNVTDRSRPSSSPLPLSSGVGEEGKAKPRLASCLCCVCVSPESWQETRQTGGEGHEGGRGRGEGGEGRGEERTGERVRGRVSEPEGEDKGVDGAGGGTGADGTKDKVVAEFVGAEFVGALRAAEERICREFLSRESTVTKTVENLLCEVRVSGEESGGRGRGRGMWIWQIWGV